MFADSSKRACVARALATADSAHVTDCARWTPVRKRLFARPVRRMWPALVAGSLAVLVACAKTVEEKAALKPGIAVAEAQAAQTALTSAQAVEAAQGTHAAAAMRAPDNVGASAAPKPGNDELGDPAPTGRARLLGQAPETNSAGELPPAAGAPHLYHLGAENFFIERAVALGFTTQQKGKLDAIKEKAERTYGATQQQIDRAEQDLWSLTSAEQPNAAQISDKISEIARLGAEQRMNYVRAVGTAVAVLDEAQRDAVIASAPAAMPSTPAAAASSAMSQGTTPAAGGMKMGGGAMTKGGSGGAMGGAKMKMQDDAMEDDDAMPMAPKAPMAPMSGTPAGGAPPGMGHM